MENAKKKEGKRAEGKLLEKEFETQRTSNSLKSQRDLNVSSKAISSKENIAASSEARYLYCIVNGNPNNFKTIGIENNEVFTISYKDISAVAHRCLQKPYETKDEETARKWILSHHYVIDQSTKKFGTVIPFGFDTIIKGHEKIVRNWLKEGYNNLKNVLGKIKDKSEFGIQIFWDKGSTKQEVEKSMPIENIEGKPRGMQFMLKKKHGQEVKNKLLEKVAKYSKDFYEQIKSHVDEIKSEPAPKKIRLPEKWKGKKMVLNLSCLVQKEKVKELGNMLGKINDLQDFSVRFTGPWAPFSFVGEIGERSQNGT